MKILVTGSNGFVGEFLTAKLKNLGHKVIEFDTEHGHNILNKEHLEKKMKGINAVFHLAAIIDNENPRLWKVNVEGTRNVVGAAVNARVKKFIFLSSTGVYGETSGLVDEKSAVNPSTPYEKSKVEAEKIVLERQEEIPVIVVRSSMILGPNDYWRKMFKMIRRRFPLPVSGKNSFQVIYVKDLVNALAVVMEKGETGETYLVSGGEAPTLNEFYEMVQEVFGMKPRAGHMPTWWALGMGRLFKINILNKDNMHHLSKERRYSTKKAEGLGWKPKYSPRELVEETIEDLKEEGHFN